MKSASKSKFVDYKGLYHTLLLSMSIFMLYIGMQCFLPLGSYLTFFLLGFSLLTIVLNLIGKQNYWLILSICCTLFTILLNLLMH